MDLFRIVFPSRTIQYHPPSYDTTNQAPRRVIARLGNVFFSSFVLDGKATKGLISPGTNMQCAKVPTDLFFSIQSCWLCLSYLKAYKSHTSAGWFVPTTSHGKQRQSKRLFLIVFILMRVT